MEVKEVEIPSCEKVYYPVHDNERESGKSGMVYQHNLRL